MSEKRVRVGWVTAEVESGMGMLRIRPWSFSFLGSFTRMRAGNIATDLNRRSRLTSHELYRSGSKYDVVVFQKVMGAWALREIATLKQKKTRVIFDTNVNYYSVWGDYDTPGIRPTEGQVADVIAITQAADLVVADSTYILSQAKRYNDRICWISDNVDMSLYKFVRVHEERLPVQLIWSGIAKKADHLLSIKEVLGQLNNIELVLVSDEPPSVMREIQAVVSCRYERFSDARYARLLSKSDIIISPKNLNNGYDFGHTEYKITLGMAAGLPVVASPQPSYLEALERGGGIIARSSVEWQDAIVRLARDAGLRATLGDQARRIVEEQYSTSVVAARYEQAILSVTVNAEK